MSGTETSHTALLNELAALKSAAAAWCGPQLCGVWPRRLPRCPTVGTPLTRSRLLALMLDSDDGR
jgi:hypothetical protein